MPELQSSMAGTTNAFAKQLAQSQICTGKNVIECFIKPIYIFINVKFKKYYYHICTYIQKQSL